MKIAYILLILLFLPMVHAINITKNLDENIVTNQTFYLGFHLIPNIDNYYDGEYWPETVKLSLFTDRGDNNLSISKCGNSYYTTLSVSGEKIVPIPIIAYYPTDYLINYTLEGKDSKVSYLMNIHATGSITDFNASTIFCPKTNLSQLNNTNYKRRVRYGFDPTINLPKERLKNHSLGLDKINYSNNSIVEQIKNLSNIIAVIYNDTNISSTIQENNTLVFDNQDEINKKTYNALGITFMVLLISVGILIFILNHYNKYKINRREKPLW